jgi:hypothetical protein
VNTFGIWQEHWLGAACTPKESTAAEGRCFAFAAFGVAGFRRGSAVGNARLLVFVPHVQAIGASGDVAILRPDFRATR